MLSFSEGSPILGDARLHLRPRKPLRSFQGLICLTINSPVLQKLCLVPSEPFEISSWPFQCLQSDTENVPLFNGTLDWTCSSIVHCTAGLYHIIPCVYIILTPKTLTFFLCTFFCVLFYAAWLRWWMKYTLSIDRPWATSFITFLCLLNPITKYSDWTLSSYTIT